MKRQSFVLMLLLASSQAFAAATPPANAKEAAARYESDKKLCAEEKTSSIRMQCLRDAKTEYDGALAALKAAPAAPAAAGACHDCGKVLAVSTGEKKGEAGALGTIGGGVAGALLGNQVGGGNGKTLATIAGAAGGAYAGRKVEEQARATKVWHVRVKMDSGEEKTFSFDHDPGLIAGTAVRQAGNSIVRQ